MVAVVLSLSFSRSVSVATSAAHKAARTLAEEPMTDILRHSGLYTANQAKIVHAMDLIPKIILWARNSCHCGPNKQTDRQSINQKQDNNESFILDSSKQAIFILKCEAMHLQSWADQQCVPSVQCERSRMTN